jgi:hypothetical protein
LTLFFATLFVSCIRYSLLATLSDHDATEPVYAGECSGEALSRDGRQFAQMTAGIALSRAFVTSIREVIHHLSYSSAATAAAATAAAAAAADADAADVDADTRTPTPSSSSTTPTSLSPSPSPQELAALQVRILNAQADVARIHKKHDSASVDVFLAHAALRLFDTAFERPLPAQSKTRRRLVASSTLPPVSCTKLEHLHVSHPLHYSALSDAGVQYPHKAFHLLNST